MSSRTSTTNPHDANTFIFGTSYLKAAQLTQKSFPATSKSLAPERRHKCRSTRGITNIRRKGTKCSRQRHLAAGISAPLDKFIENFNPGKI